MKYNSNKWVSNDKKRTQIFLKHLSEVFLPYPSEVISEEGYLEAPFQMDYPRGKIKTKEIRSTIISFSLSLCENSD